MQSLVFVIVEQIWQQFTTFKFERDLFTAPDKGTLGVDWYVTKDHPEGRPSKNDTRPILLLVPGMSGLNNMMCIDDIAKAFVIEHKRKCYLAEVYPNLKQSDIEILSQLVTEEDIKQYEKDRGN